MDILKINKYVILKYLPKKAIILQVLKNLLKI